MDTPVPDPLLQNRRAGAFEELRLRPSRACPLRGGKLSVATHSLAATGPDEELRSSVWVVNRIGDLVGGMTVNWLTTVDLEGVTEGGSQ